MPVLTYLHENFIWVISLWPWLMQNLLEEYLVKLHFFRWTLFFIFISDGHYKSYLVEMKISLIDEWEIQYFASSICHRQFTNWPVFNLNLKRIAWQDLKLPLLVNKVGSRAILPNYSYFSSLDVRVFISSFLLSVFVFFCLGELVLCRFWKRGIVKEG